MVFTMVVISHQFWGPRICQRPSSCQTNYFIIIVFLFLTSQILCPRFRDDVCPCQITSNAARCTITHQEELEILSSASVTHDMRSSNILA